MLHEDARPRRHEASDHGWAHVEFYITAWDDVTGPFYEELARAVDRGVEVRLLFDHTSDPRASRGNYEVSLMLLGPEVVAEMRKVEDHYRSISKELILEDWLTRSRGAAVDLAD